MVVFWRGWGWTIPLIMFGWIFVAVGYVIATAPPGGNPNAAKDTDRLFALVFVLSAATVYLLDSWRRRGSTPVVDPATGETILIKNADHFMFIPAKYYPWVFLAIAVYMMAKSFGELPTTVLPG